MVKTKLLKSKKIKLLKDYFKKETSVVLAFIFGSQAKNLERRISDWDIAVYFRPRQYQYPELETKKDYPRESEIQEDLEKTIEKKVDFLVLNRARPDLVYSVLSSGIPLIIKDRKLYLDLLCKTSYEAIDFWNFVLDYWRISQKSKSFLPEEKARLSEYLRFLENEFGEIKEIKKISWPEYLEDSFKRKIVERWIENLVMAALDIAKIILASKKREIPQSYKEILKVFMVLELKFSLKEAENFSKFAELRNIVVHEYLDIKWKKIKDFIQRSQKFFPTFLKKVKIIIEN